METFQQRYEKATVWLAINKGLFAQLMYAVPNLVNNDVPTAATDGRKRMFNPEFIDKFPYKQQAGVMVHEILHDALLHKARVGDRDHRVWNYACDIKINNILLKSGVELPKEGVFDHKGQTFDALSEEQIYDEIMKDTPPKSEDGGGSGGDGIPEDYEGDIVGGELSVDEVAQQKGRLQVAIEMHGAGSLPKELQDAINAILNPKEKWFEWLRKYFTSKQISGCDWTAVCRREYIRSGLVAPPFRSDSLGVIVISVDQSGSIGQQELDYFAGHVNSIMMGCKPDKIVVQYFDTKVHDTDEFTYQDLPIVLRRVCGGGTSFVDPCAKAEEHEASVHIILTDMMGSFPDDSNISTIWASTSGIDTAPFGDVVNIIEGE